MNWESAKNWLMPIENVSKYKSKWVCVCDFCQNERFVSYGQARNLLIGVNKRKCRDCQVKHGELTYNIEGLKLGHGVCRKLGKSNKSKKLSKLLTYRAIFDCPSKKPEVRKKMSESRRKIPLGEAQSAWKGGLTSKNNILRGSLEYKELRIFVFKRDGFTCQICAKFGGDLEMDHIKEWCNYPDLRFEPTNCRTLCKKCHATTDNYKHKAKQKRKELCQSS
jgi:hypothetical protein